MLDKEARSIASPAVKKDTTLETAPDRKEGLGQKPISSTLIQKKTRHMKEAKWKAAGWP
jgi:hypothetical protein